MPRKKFLKPKDKALALAEAAYDKKAENIVVLHMTKLSDIADYYVICSADSDRGVKTIVENVEKKCKELDTPRLGTEGLKESKWVLVDAADVIVHVFYEPVRDEFDIESLWNEAPKVKLPFEQEQMAR